MPSWSDAGSEGLVAWLEELEWFKDEIAALEAKIDPDFKN